MFFSQKKQEAPTSPTSIPKAPKPQATAPTSRLNIQSFGLNNNVSKKEFVRFSVYVVLLFIIIFNNLDVQNSYEQNTYFVSILSSSGSLSLLMPTYTPDLQTTFQETILNILKYNENNFVPVPSSVSNDTLIFNNSLLLKTITDLRITQTRVQTETNSSIVWKNPIEMMSNDYGTNNTFKYQKDQGGFPQFLPLFTTNLDQNMSLKGVAKWNDILNYSYFDAHTYTVKIDFAYISNCLDIMTYMIILSEILPSGVAKTTVEVRTFNFGFFGSNATASTTAVNVTYIIFFAYYFIVMFIKIYYDIKHVDIDDEILGAPKKRDSESVSPDATGWERSTTKNKLRTLEKHATSFLNSFQKPKQYLLRTFIGLKRHLSQTNNLIDLFVNIMNILLLIITFKLTTMEDFFNEYESIAKSAGTANFDNRVDTDSAVIRLREMNNKIDGLSLQMNNYQIYCSMIALVQCFKILSYLISFSSSLQRFFTIISNILDVLFFYLLLIAVIFMSFVLLVRNFYGYQIPEFTDIYATSVYLFGMISGYNQYLTTMWNKSPEFTLFFHIAYNFIIVFILMNMFLVIVKNEFSRFQSEIKKKNEAGNDYLSRFKYKPSFVYVIKEKLQTWYMNILFYVKKADYYLKKNLQKEMELHMRNDVNLYNHIDFDVNFVDMLQKYQNLQAKNSMVEAEKAKININKQKEYVKGIWQLLFLMISLGLYIFLVTQFFQTEENYNLSSSVTQTLHKPYPNPREVNGNIDATSLANLNDVLYYMISAFPSSFSTKYYYRSDSNSTSINETLIKTNPSFNEFMFLVNRQVRMTVRKTKKTVNNNYFHSVSPYIITPAFSYDADYSDVEDMRNTKFANYSTGQSYASKGGYVFFFNPVDDLKNNITFLNQEGFFDETLNSITLDFVLANVIKNKFLYCLMVFQFGNTGGVEMIDLVLPYRRINFSSVLDICITVLLSLIIFIYFIYVVKFVKAVVFKAESYQTWYSMFIKHTIPTSLLFHRERKQPELFRKVAYVFDFKSVLNILFFLFTGVFIILMIFLQVSVLEIENKANIFQTDLATLMRYITWRIFENPGESENLGEYLNLSEKLMQMLDMIALFAALSAFILVFQILYFYSKKNSFYVIINSILVSLREIPFMIAVLLAFLFAFAIYGYLLLGKLHPKYHTFANSVRTLFEYLSHIDDIEFFMQQSSMLGFFTLLVPFFLSVKLVIINMFFSIIYRAYEKSKNEGEKQVKEEVQLTFREFWVITYKLATRNYEEKESSLELYSQMLHKTDIEELFLKMKDTIRISNQNTNIHIWANICSEEIRNEYEKRNFLKEKCDEIMKNYFFKNSAGDKYFRLIVSNLNKKCVEYELRKNYWDYFRIAHQYLNRYDFYFRNRIVELNERLKNREEIEKEKEAENSAFKKYITDLMKRLEDNKKDIADVKKEIKKLRMERELGDEEEEEEENNDGTKSDLLRKSEDVEGDKGNDEKKDEKNENED